MPIDHNLRSDDDDRPESPERRAHRALMRRIDTLQDLADDESLSPGERLRALELLAELARLDTHDLPEQGSAKHAAKKHAARKHAAKKHAAKKHAAKKHAAKKLPARKHAGKRIAGAKEPRRLTEGGGSAMRRLGSGR